MRKAILCLVLFSLTASACGPNGTALPPTQSVIQIASPDPWQTQTGSSDGSSPIITPAESPSPVAPISPSGPTSEAPTLAPALTALASAKTPIGPLMIEGLQAIQLIGDPQAGDNFYALTPAGLYITRDGGLTWIQVTSEPLQDTFTFSLAEPGILYTGVGADCYRDSPDQPFYKSINGGATWSELPSGIDLHPVAVHPSDPNQLWATGCAGPAYSSDGGETWTISSAELFLTYDVSHIVPVSADWSVVYLGGVSEGGSGVIARSQDSGANWTPVLRESLSDTASGTGEQLLWWINDLLVFSSASPPPQAEGRDVETGTQIFVVDPHGVWHSRDGGDTWRFSNIGLEDVVYRDGVDFTSIGLNVLAVDNSATPMIVYLGTAQGVYQSSDEGETWTKLSNDPADSTGWQQTPIRNLVLSPPKNASPGTTSQLFITTDKGVYVFEP